MKNADYDDFVFMELIKDKLSANDIRTQPTSILAPINTEQPILNELLKRSVKSINDLIRRGNTFTRDVLPDVKDVLTGLI